jgi:hypothetical protein
MVDRRKAHRGLVGKSEGKRPLGRRNCRFKGNIKMDVSKIGKEDCNEFIWLRIGTGGEPL